MLNTGTHLYKSKKRAFTILLHKTSFELLLFVSLEECCMLFLTALTHLYKTNVQSPELLNSALRRHSRMSCVICLQHQSWQSAPTLLFSAFFTIVCSQHQNNATPCRSGTFQSKVPQQLAVVILLATLNNRLESLDLAGLSPVRTDCSATLLQCPPASTAMHHYW